jgi:hypothetical protein
MISIKNVPIVIEPGVNVLEAEFCVRQDKRTCTFPIQLFRIALDKKTAPDLPFIPSVRLPHVFGLSNVPSEALILVVYDSMGRISTLYTRQHVKESWEKEHIAEEYAGKTVTRFSVRYSFSSHKNRQQFMELVDTIMTQINNDKLVAPGDVVAAFMLLSKARATPVVMPVAALKD